MLQSPVNRCPMNTENNPPCEGNELGATSKAEFVQLLTKRRHDLRSTVSVILGFADWLIEEVQGKEHDPRREDLKLIRRLANEMDTELTQCLDYQKIKTKRSDIAGLQQLIARNASLILEAIGRLGEASTNLDDSNIGRGLTTISESGRQLRDLPSTCLSFLLDPAVEFLVSGESILLRRPPVEIGACKDSPAIPLLTCGRILVVDDSEDNRELLRQRLTRLGHSVLLGVNGRQALEIVAKNTVDLVLLDILMPELDGFATLNRLKGNADTQDIPVVMLSAADDISNVIRCLELGADDFLPKPFNATLLAVRIESSLAKKRLRDHLESSLASYLSPELVKQIKNNPNLIKPGGELKTVSILISDIAGFSKVSERMGPDDLIKLLNDYYEAAISCIHQTNGTVVSLVGDSMLALWNAPVEQADHSQRACKSAVLLHERMIQFDSAHRTLPLHTRVGLHTGSVCVGNLGSPGRVDFTAIGENVNLASRLEGLNKHLGTHTLATRDIVKSAGNELTGRPIGQFKFKGFDRVVEIHELFSVGEGDSNGAAWLEAFAEALHQFQRRGFKPAATAFRRTLELRPQDGPSQFYLDLIKRYRNSPPAADWMGEVNMDEK